MTKEEEQEYQPPTMPTSGNGFWCWKETDGQMYKHKSDSIYGNPADCWVKYDASASNKLESAYQANKVVRCSPSSGYVVNFATMEQTNTATGYQRRVKRVAEATEEKQQYQPPTNKGQGDDLEEGSIADFNTFTGNNDRNVAQKYLGMANGDVRTAVNMYMDNSDGGGNNNGGNDNNAGYVSPSSSNDPPGHPANPPAPKPKPAGDNANTNEDRPLGTSSVGEWVSEHKRLVFAIVGAILITTIGVLIASFSKVDEIEYGVQYDIHAKDLDDAAKSGGLFIGPPGYRFIKFPSTYISTNFDGRTCVSKDGLLVGFSVTFQYQILEMDVPLVIEKYRDYKNWATVVEQAALSAIHHSCSEFFIAQFQNDRPAIQSAMLANLKRKLEGDGGGREGVYAQADSVQIVGFDLPQPYKNAISNKQEAEEDIALAKAQRVQSLTRANTDLRAAEKEAQRILETATNEAAIILKEAQLKANAILYSFETETEALVAVKDSLELSPDGMVSRQASIVLSEVEQSPGITMGEPARLSRKNVL